MMSDNIQMQNSTVEEENVIFDASETRAMHDKNLDKLSYTRRHLQVLDKVIKNYWCWINGEIVIEFLLNFLHIFGRFLSSVLCLRVKAINKQNLWLNTRQRSQCSSSSVYWSTWTSSDYTRSCVFKQCKQFVCLFLIFWLGSVFWDSTSQSEDDYCHFAHIRWAYSSNGCHKWQSVSRTNKQNEHRTYVYYSREFVCVSNCYLPD